jgi:hypothetical protein
MCRLSKNLGPSTSWSPKGLSRPVMGLLFTLCYFCIYFTLFCYLHITLPKNISFAFIYTILLVFCTLIYHSNLFTFTPLYYLKYKGQFPLRTFSLALQPKSASLTTFVDHTQLDTHTHTPGITHLNDWSARRRGLCLQNTKQTSQTNIRAFSGIRTRDPSNREAADLRLRPHDHRDRLLLCMFILIPLNFQNLPFKEVNPILPFLTRYSVFFHTPTYEDTHIIIWGFT